MSIDWEQVAKQNNMTPTEFSLEIFQIAALLGAMRIDSNESEDDTLMFKSGDGNGGEVEVYIRRVKKGNEND